MTAPSRSLVTLLSQALVAFTVEVDNEYEAGAPHSTTSAGRRSGPWLTSVAFWTNGLRHVGDGVTVEELRQRARTLPNVDGLRRWGYLRADGPVLRLTAPGRRAGEYWAPVPGRVEARWRDRFGAPTVDRLRASLAAVAGDLGTDLPDAMPMVGYGLRSDGNVAAGPPPVDVADRSLAELLSRVLLALALAYEQRSRVSLAVAATVLRLVDDRDLAVADIPGRSGVGRETTAVAVGWLTRHGLAEVGTGRGRALTLTASGQRARADFHRRLGWLEASAAERWPDPVADAATALAAVVGSPRLAEGLVPPASGWRGRAPYRRQTDAWLADPAGTLPHFPVVTHRGGFPDGN